MNYRFKIFINGVKLFTISIFTVAMAVTTASAQTKNSPGGNKQTAAQSSKPIYRNTKYSFRERAADLSGRACNLKAAASLLPLSAVTACQGQWSSS